MIKTIIKLLCLLIITLSAAVGYRVWMGYQRLLEPVAFEAPQLFRVEPGDRLQGVVRRLSERGLVVEPELLYLYGRYHQLDRALKVGEFEFSGVYAANQVLRKLTSNETKHYPVTFHEGMTFAEMVRHLQQQPEITVLLEGDMDAIAQQVLVSVKSDFSHPEGLFFPSTYHYSAGMTDLMLLTRAYQTMSQTLTELWQQRQMGLPYKTPYEALIMASIVEKETGVPEERQAISGVFYRRLQKGMRLQTDPTIIYGLGETFDGNLKRTHLRDKNNPYNTYQINGLPPTPIAAPGRAAIHAALNPAEGTALYFVAKGDGSHQFSDTLQQHNQAVKRYQLQRRADYRSTR